MKTRILLLLILLGMSFSALNATPECSEIEVVAVQETLQSYSTSESETVEVVIHNPEYCLSNITDITLSDSENFELDLDFGAVPCGSDDFSMRGYQFCTVGVTFKPVTSSGTFETDVLVSTTSTPVTSAEIKGDIVICDECNDDDDDDDDGHGGCGHGGHGGCGNGHGGHGKGCGNGHGGHGKGCGNGHGGHGKGCGNDRGDSSQCNHRHNRRCGHDGGHGQCGHKHNRRCGYEDDNDNGHDGHGKGCDNDRGDSSQCNHRHNRRCGHDGGHGQCGHKHNRRCGYEDDNDNGHDGHGKGCDNDRGDSSQCNHRHNRRCGHDGGHGQCGHKHNRRCGYEDDNDNEHTCPPLAPVKKLVDSEATNYIDCLNLTNPVGTSVVEVYDDIVYFNDYNEKDVGLATFELDQTIDFESMLTFTANVESGLFMPRMSGDDGRYMTTDVRTTKQYGFIFPNAFPLSELNFTTWGVSFTGSIVDLSVTEMTNTNLLSK